MENVLEKVSRALNKNNINALLFQNKLAAVDYLKSVLKAGETVTCGGSVTLAESGVYSLISNGDYNFLDRTKLSGDKAETTAFYKNTLSADSYFCSANAVTENGEIVNVDGMGNRITASAFGPERVFMIVGKNKIVKDLEEAFLRIKKVASPRNAVRLSLPTPCAKIGKCVSLLKSDKPGITDGCDSPYRICRDYLILGKQNDKKRITVLLINEELGY